MLESRNFQIFYVSKEESNCPLIADSIRLQKELKSKGFDDVIISQRYGKRILIDTINHINLKQSFLEIVDYDPIRNVLLIMGSNKPRIETPLHWFIHHAREEVNAIVQINDESIFEKLKNTPITEKDYSIVTLEQIKEVLKHLKNSKKIIIKNLGVIFIGNNIKEVGNLISEVLK